MKGLILSAGSHAELAPINATAPIGALPLLGRPILAHQLERMSELGVQEVLVVLHHKPFPVERTLQAYAPEGMNVRVVLVRELSGTAHALREHASFLSETTLVMLGDIVERLNLAGALERHRARGAVLSAIVSERSLEACRGGAAALGTDGRLTAFDERPEPWPQDPNWFVSTGLYLVEPTVVEHIPDCPFDLGADLLPQLIRAGHPVYGELATGRWRDAGTPGGYFRAQMEALEGLYVDPLASVHPAAKIVGPAWIGPGCRIEREAEVGPLTVLAHDVHLLRGAKVERTVVLGGTRLGKATRWSERLVWRHGSFDVTRPTSAFELSADPEELTSTLSEPWSERLGQVLDSLLAAFGLLLLSPLLLAIALLVYVDDPGPVVYSQLRVGQDRRAFRLGSLRGRVFELYKFRTMVVDADRRLAALKSQNQYGEGAFFKLERDPRITRIGHFLRKTSLDELPQLINVLLGDMRLVGNRPLPVYEAEALSEDWQRIRFACPAGITGLWQISGRSDLSEKERMVLDSYYSVTRSFWTDWVILAKTIPALLLRRGAR